MGCGVFSTGARLLKESIRSPVGIRVPGLNEAVGLPIEVSGVKSGHVRTRYSMVVAE